MPLAACARSPDVGRVSPADEGIVTETDPVIKDWKRMARSDESKSHDTLTSPPTTPLDLKIETIVKFEPENPGMNNSTRSPSVSIISAVKLSETSVTRPAMGGSNKTWSVPFREPTASTTRTLVAGTDPATAVAARVMLD